METNDAPARPGRHSAATPELPPVTRRERRAAERREISAAEFGDTSDFPGAPRRQEPWPVEAPASGRSRGTTAGEVPVSHAATPPEARLGVVARRTALSMAGSGVALVGIAVATRKAPDSQTLDEATRDIVAGTPKSKAKPTPKPAPATHAQTEDQVAATGKAPAPAKAKPGVTVKQPPTILSLDPALHLAAVPRGGRRRRWSRRSGRWARPRGWSGS